MGYVFRHDFGIPCFVVIFLARSTIKYQRLLKNTYQIKFLVRLAKLMVTLHHCWLGFGKIRALHTQEKVKELANSIINRTFKERYRNHTL